VYFLISKQGKQFLSPRFKLSRPCRHCTRGGWNYRVQASMSAMATGTPKCNDTIGLKMRNNRVARTARAAHILVKFLDEFCKTTRKKKTNKFRRQHEPTTVNLSIPTFTSIPLKESRYWLLPPCHKREEIILKYLWESKYIFWGGVVRAVPLCLLKLSYCLPLHWYHIFRPLVLCYALFRNSLQSTTDHVKNSCSI